MTKPAPLAGIKVIELARVLAGPWAGQVLADLGAEVIKVESPQGDDTRKWGPPFIENADGTKDAAYFHATDGDAPALEALARRYRVAWTIFTPGDPAVAVLDSDPAWRRIHADPYAVAHERVAPYGP